MINTILIMKNKPYFLMCYHSSNLWTDTFLIILDIYILDCLSFIKLFAAYKVRHTITIFDFHSLESFTNFIPVLCFQCFIRKWHFSEYFFGTFSTCNHLNCGPTWHHLYITNFPPLPPVDPWFQ